MKRLFLCAALLVLSVACTPVTPDAKDPTFTQMGVKDVRLADSGRECFGCATGVFAGVSQGVPVTGAYYCDPGACYYRVTK